MPSHLAVIVRQGRTEKFSKFTGRIAPEQIHLKESILRMEKTGREGYVDAAPSPEGGNSQGVAVDLDPLLDPGPGNRAVEEGSAAQKDTDQGDQPGQGDADADTEES
jgi:hypothetical protein